MPPTNPSSTVVDKHDTGTSSQLSGINVVAMDDDPVALKALERHLLKRGCGVSTARNGEDGLELLTDDVSVALIDMRMPGLSGLDCLKYLNQYHPAVKVIFVTGSSDVSMAVEAMKQGAFQYVSKPFEPESLAVQVQKAHEAWKVARENSGLREVISYPEMPAKLVSDQTDLSVELTASVARIAQLDSTVFIGGESGTGKTTVARMIHQAGPRARGPFIAINCASLPRELIESELFGHARGAFTGAVKERIGKAEIANGGTLFLDEIGDLPLELQPKLLTFIQDRCIQRVGCNVTRHVDVRLIVATHRDLAQLSRENLFRQDLYYRLNVLSLQLLPLRQRDNEIEAIAKSVVQSICKRLGRQPIQLMAGAIAAIGSYHWPGNIRELENVLERAIAFANRPQLFAEDLIFDQPTNMPSQPTRSPDALESPQLAGLTLGEIEALAIRETLAANDGNKAASARMLGISEKSIYNKMKRLGICYPSESGKRQ